jgi:Subtilisin inhibitor-like
MQGPAASLRVVGGIAVLVLTAVLSACAGAADGAGPAADAGGDAGAAAGDGISPADDDLVVEYDPGDGSPLESWSLTCGGSVEGSHPDAAAACAHLTGLDDPFAPLPDDLACTEIYGGPQSAHVAGQWGGRPIDLDLSRVDGCRISQWDGLGPLLPAAVGVEPVG